MTGMQPQQPPSSRAERVDSDAELSAILRYSADGCPIGHWETDSDGLIFNASGEMFPDLGLRCSSIGQFVHHAFNDAPSVVNDFQKAILGETTVSPVYLWGRSYRVVQVPTRLGVTGVATDVTEHNAVEDRLAKSDRWLQASYQLAAIASRRSSNIDEILREGLSDAARTTHAEHGALFLLEEGTDQLRLAEVYGFDGESLPGTSETGAKESISGEAVRRRMPVTVDLRHPDEYPYGQLRHIVRQEGIQSIAAVPLLSGDEALGAVTLFSTDFGAFGDSDRELLMLIGSQLGAAIHRSHSMELLQRERNQLRQRVEEQTAELRKSNEAMQRLLSTVGHELQQPVTAIMMLSSSLSRSLQEGLDERQKRMLDGIQSNTQHMSGLVTDIMDVSRFQRGDLELSLSENNLGEWLEGVAEGVRPRLESKDQRLVLSLPEGPLVAKVDPQRLLQVIDNLVSNASKYSPDGSEVCLGAEARGHDLVLTVADQGYGMTEEDQARALDPFFRSEDSSIRAERGFGLGLSVVKMLVDLHSGRIEVDSEPGGGSTFTVTLPGAIVDS